MIYYSKTLLVTINPSVVPCHSIGWFRTGWAYGKRSEPPINWTEWPRAQEFHKRATQPRGKLMTKWTSCDLYLIYTGWWLTYPSEKYEFVSWNDDIPNIWKKTCSKPPTSMYIYMYTHSWIINQLITWEALPMGLKQTSLNGFVDQ